MQSADSIESEKNRNTPENPFRAAHSDSVLLTGAVSGPSESCGEPAPVINIKYLLQLCAGCTLCYVVRNSLPSDRIEPNSYQKQFTAQAKEDTCMS